MKISDNEYIYYGSTAEKYFNKQSSELTTEVSDIKNPDVITDKDGSIRVRYSTADVINSKTIKNGSDKNVCLYYAKRMMGNAKIKLNSEKTSNNLYSTIINEINEGRPMLLKARKTAKEQWRYVLIYAYNNSSKITNKSKFYIIDPLNGTYGNLKNYIVASGTKDTKYSYITINGEHSNEVKKQEITNNSTNANNNNTTTNAGNHSGNTYVARNNRTYTLYKQIDYYQRYWDNTIATDGCGPTSCAIIASAYGSKDTPATIVANMDY